MRSLRQLLNDHAPLLLLDACSSRVQVGWLANEAAMRWAHSDEEAGIGLFKCIEQLSVQPQDAAGFLFCDGPGSLLGTRTVAMAIRTWNTLTPRPAYSYHSLVVVAHALQDEGSHVIADARRDSWHCARLGQPLRRIATADLPDRLVTPEGFRNWTPIPPQVNRTGYTLSSLLPQVIDSALFVAREAPDAFLHEEPSYVTWTPQIHRGP
jgi:tRNA threonylcarbamoyladenosine biosynthesis protein TsaB